MNSNNQELPGNPGNLGGQPSYAEVERLTKELFEEAQRLHPNGGIVITIVAPGAQNIAHLDSQTIIYQGGQDGMHPGLSSSDRQKSEPKSKNVYERIRDCIELLMQEKYTEQVGNRTVVEPLFNQQSHWQAVYRVLADKEYCEDSDFDGFDVLARKSMPDKVNKPYSKASVKQISQTDFCRPFCEWKFDEETSRTRKPFDRMVAVTQRFLEILEGNGL